MTDESVTDSSEDYESSTNSSPVVKIGGSLPVMQLFKKRNIGVNKLTVQNHLIEIADCEGIGHYGVLQDKPLHGQVRMVMMRISIDFMKFKVLGDTLKIGTREYFSYNSR